MRIFTLLFLIIFSYQTWGQTGKSQCVLVSATAVAGGGVRLTWPQSNYAGNYQVFKRKSITKEDWGSAPFVVLPGNAANFFDSTVSIGEAYEYKFVKINGTTIDAFGYIYAGNQLKEPSSFPTVILLIDSFYKNPLSTQIARLQQDLLVEGYLVTTIYAGRTQSPPTIKNYLKGVYSSAKVLPKALFIIGHVPVPYSGWFSTDGDAPPPDGHVEGSGNHTGAWPADAYYGDVKDHWTDFAVVCSTGIQPRIFNLLGDGKFDQTKLPDTLVMQVGRVDLTNMPLFKKSDTVLTANYLDRNHNWRTGQWQASERALIDDNFTSLNLSSTGYQNFAALVRADSIFTNRDYMTSQKKGNYLWSYGCGAGSFTSCSGIGVTSDFVNDSFSNVFTMLAGSFFGDWDNQNNLLRAPLCQSSLTSCWGGIPKWYLHHMGLGSTIGNAARITQNNSTFYFDGGFNSSGHSVHIALMGDPTLKMRNIGSVQALQAKSVKQTINLSWTSALGQFDGYAVYRVDTDSNKFIRLNASAITDTFYTDNSQPPSGNYTYAVRPLRLETSASGSYINVGGAAFTTINFVNGLNTNQQREIQVAVFPNPSLGQFHVQSERDLMNAEASVYDLSGRLLLTQRASGNSFDISLWDQPDGLYVLKVTSDNAITVRKLMLQK